MTVCRQTFGFLAIKFQALAIGQNTSDTINLFSFDLVDVECLSMK